MISKHDIWLHPPERLLLKSDEVHVWRADLDQEPATIRTLSEILTPDERQRAERFYFQKDREHFTVARGVLRIIFSRYLNISPELIRFSYNQYGKPALDDPLGDASLRFNLSHSHGMALYAFTRGREIGLDIEFIREDFASLEIAESFFSPKEVEMLRALSSEHQCAAFFNCWTRKEAYIKALGEGLSHPLHRFTVSFIAGEPAALLSTDDDPEESSRWSLIELTPGPGYVAALAVSGRAPIIHHLQWLA
jgi:4'-phosphopantetheinyl transferase